jgi:hypothetical protein
MQIAGMGSPSAETHAQRQLLPGWANQPGASRRYFAAVSD